MYEIYNIYISKRTKLIHAYIKTLQQAQLLNVSITVNNGIGTNSICSMHIYIYIFGLPRRFVSSFCQNT